MALTTAAGEDFLQLLFTNVDWPNVGDAAGLQNSATAGSFYISLHTASPGVGGNQTTSEISYTGYGRVAVARSVAGFTVSGLTCTNAADITFGACTAGSGTVTYVGLGTDSSGAGNLIAYAAVSSPGGGLAVSAGITPRIAATGLDWTAA